MRRVGLVLELPDDAADQLAARLRAAHAVADPVRLSLDDNPDAPLDTDDRTTVYASVVTVDDRPAPPTPRRPPWVSREDC